MSHAAQIAKYERWLGELESRRDRLAQNRDRYIRFFVGAMVASAAGFVCNAWIGIASLFTGGMVCMFGCYVVLLRGWEYTREIGECKRRIASLQRSALNAELTAS
jgi:hypothetical protein